MHGLLGYQDTTDDDTEVIDVDDWHQLINLGRVPTDELTMHIMPLNTQTGHCYWHRLHESTGKTACGMPVSFLASDVRYGRRIEHPLSPHCDCWTKAERAEADQAYLKKFGREYKP